MWYKNYKKFPNKRTEYAGRKYDSKFEAGVAADLELRRLAGEIREITPQKTFDLFGKNGHKICTHRPDFYCIMADGSEEIFEAKGMEMPVWKIKRDLFIDNYPDIKYTVIAQGRGYRQTRNRGMR